MSHPTWRELMDFHCSIPRTGDALNRQDNPLYEKITRRRYNYSALPDVDAVRLLFLREAVSGRPYSTLRRRGRFLWCRNLQYEGRDNSGYRQVSFTVDKGQKRFLVAENNLLCLPSRTYVGNRKFFSHRERTFFPFSSVFRYENAINIMKKNSAQPPEELSAQIVSDNPYTAGTLVSPRLGYFYPQTPSGGFKTLTENINVDAAFPCGLILGPSFHNEAEFGREFYRVRFGDTTYERVHAVEMEILNEV